MQYRTTTTSLYHTKVLEKFLIAALTHVSFTCEIVYTDQAITDLHSSRNTVFARQKRLF